MGGKQNNPIEITNRRKTEHPYSNYKWEENRISISKLQVGGKQNNHIIEATAVVKMHNPYRIIC